MKAWSIIILIILAIAFGIFVRNWEGRPAADFGATYADPVFPFAIAYLNDFALIGGNASTSIPLTYMGTCSQNFIEKGRGAGFCYVGSDKADGFSAAVIRIQASSTMSARDCAEPEQSIGNSGDKAPVPVMINGITFYKSAFSDAGLGHYVKTDSYRTYHEGACYTADLAIESSIGQTGMGLNADFASRMRSKIEAVLSTFHFTK